MNLHLLQGVLWLLLRAWHSWLGDSGLTHLNLLKGVLQLLLRPWHSWLGGGGLMNLNLSCRVSYDCYYDPDIPDLVVVDWWIYIYFTTATTTLTSLTFCGWVDAFKFTAGFPTTTTSTLKFLTLVVDCMVSYCTTLKLNLLQGVLRLLLRPWHPRLRCGGLLPWADNDVAAALVPGPRLSHDLQLRLHLRLQQVSSYFKLQTEDSGKFLKQTEVVGKFKSLKIVVSETKTDWKQR